MTGSPKLFWKSKKGAFLAYSGMIAGALLLYLLIRAVGATLVASGPAPARASTAFAQAHVNDFLHLLLALALVIGAARSLGSLCQWLHQPPVIGEMIAGILLGPSLLGQFAPAAYSYLLPQSIAPLLNTIAQFGVILYMFIVGLELNPSVLRGKGHSAVAISHASILGPFLLGTLLALVIYPRFASSNVNFTTFSLFLGVSMSITAFPVLARILTDRGISRTRLGSMTLTCAAVDDVTAWCLLALVVAITQLKPGHALSTFALACLYILLMATVVRSVVGWASKRFERRGKLTQGALAAVLLIILMSSFTTEWIGIHAIFGAFALGAIIPHTSTLARELRTKLEDFTVVFLLPAFFAFTGLRTRIGLLNGLEAWLWCALIIAVASIGKFGGSAIAARYTGLSWRESSAIGILMNTRGLVELIVLNIGLDLGVISPLLFAMLVLMALATTMATTPILNGVLKGAEPELTLVPAEYSSERELV
jgi:Kef-type K+ transport system membrane component KefB